MLRFVLIGPVLGASIGLAQTAVAAIVWDERGRPDFYFRGWSGVELGAVMWSTGGAAAGVLFGLVVLLVENALGRKVRVFPAMAFGVIASVISTWVIVESEFARRELMPPFFTEGAAILITCGLMYALSYPTSSDRARQ